MLAVLLAPGHAHADAGCAFDGSRHVMRLAIAATPVTVSRDGDAIDVDGQPCGEATVTTVDTIEVVGPSDSVSGLRIDLRGGPLAPGFTDEPGSSDEIEFAFQLDGVGQSVSDVTVIGSDQADHVVVGSDMVSLDGDDGDSEFDVAPTTLRLDLGAGDDIVDDVGSGWHAPGYLVVRGGEGDDVLTGGTGQDDLDGGPGDDRLSGRGGWDRVVGGPGDDTLDGGGDATADYGAATAPVVADLATGLVASDGQGGSDTIAGVTSLRSGDGDDLITGDDAANRIDTAGGDDVVSGGAGDDTVDGGAGDDRLDGGAGADHLLGRSGDDRLTGGEGDDVLELGTGQDSADGGDGRDLADLQDSRTSVVDLAAGTVRYSDGTGPEDLRGVEDVSTEGRGDVVNGDDGPNRLTATGPDAVVRGHGGDDVLWGRADYSDAPAAIRVRDKTVSDGEGGTDTLRFGDVIGSAYGDDITSGGRISGGPGDDVLSGADSFDNSISGGPGDDVIRGGTAADRLDGGPGADAIDGRGGGDTVAFADATTGVDVDLAAGTVTADGTGSSDTLQGIARVFGTPWDDTIRGGPEADWLYGNGGDDVIDGRGGNDDITGAGRLDGGPGDDRLSADVRDGTPATLSGGPGDDALIGRRLVTITYADSPNGVHVTPGGVDDGFGGTDTMSDPDRLIGSAHDDVLTDAEQIDGGPGDDDIAGGTVVTPGPGRDVVRATENTARRIHARDGESDDIRCGSQNHDVVWADDEATDHVGATCSDVERPPPTASETQQQPPSQPDPAPAPAPPAQAAAPSPSPTAAAPPPVATPRSPSSGPPRLVVRHRAHGVVTIRASRRTRVLIRVRRAGTTRTLRRTVGPHGIRLRFRTGSRVTVRLLRRTA